MASEISLDISVLQELAISMYLFVGADSHVLVPVVTGLPWDMSLSGSGNQAVLLLYHANDESRTFQIDSMHYAI